MKNSYLLGLTRGKIWIGRSVVESHDCLVHKLCLRMENEDSNFRPAVHLLRINDQRKFFAKKDKDIVPHLMHSRDLLISWINGPSAVGKFRDNMKKIILTEYHGIAGKLRSSAMGSSSLPVGDTFLANQLLSNANRSINMSNDYYICPEANI